MDRCKHAKRNTNYSIYNFKDFRISDLKNVNHMSNVIELLLKNDCILNN